MHFTSKPHNNLIPHMISRAQKYLGTGEALIWFKVSGIPKSMLFHEPQISDIPSWGWMGARTLSSCCSTAKRCWPWEDLVLAKTKQVFRDLRPFPIHPSEKEHLVFFKYENRMKKNLPFAQGSLPTLRMSKTTLHFKSKPTWSCMYYYWFSVLLDLT